MCRWRWVRAGSLERCVHRRPSATPTRWSHTGTTGQCRRSLESTGGPRLCMRCLTMFRRQHYLIVYESVRGPMVRYLCQVRAPAAVAGQRGAGRRGDALPPLHTPRHGGHPAHHPHRLPEVGAVDMRVDMSVDIIYIIYYLPRQAAHHHALHRAARGRVAGPGGPGLPPADECC